jgi:transposase InsO family protein
VVSLRIYLYQKGGTDMPKEEKRRQEIAMFRYKVIAPLTGRKRLEKGEREKIISDITKRKWDIPGTTRTSISRATVLYWLRSYTRSGGDLFSLSPKPRKDRGRSRKLDVDTEMALVNFRKDNKDISIALLIDLARKEGILPMDIRISMPAVYRILRKHLDLEEYKGKSRKRFEAQLPNDLWQADCMHGPYVVHNGKKKKTFLFAIIDDHSRLITHAQFYFRENTSSFMDCLANALAKRGLPASLYTDNGAYFKSSRLEFTLARLGVALVHAKPYSPEGKGKIERWFRTVRSSFLPLERNIENLDSLNDHLTGWINNIYHTRKHASTKNSPLKRYLDQLHLIRRAPADLSEYFRIRVKRKVNRDRTVSVKNKIYEAPTALIGRRIDLLYHEDTPEQIEAYFNERSYGKLHLVDVNHNFRDYSKKDTPFHDSEKDNEVSQSMTYTGGALFTGGDRDE